MCGGKEVKNSWTLVAGGAKGVGASIAMALAKKGNPIIIQYRKSKAEASQTAEACRNLGSEAEIIEGDFSSKESTADFLERYLAIFPQTANLVYNVGNYFRGTVTEASSELWYEIFETNLHAPYFMIKALLPNIKREKGSIVNIGVCGLGRSRADKYAAVYAITKESLWSLTLSLAKELAPDGVRVNMVSPGLIEGEKATGSICIPMKRAATYEEVARAVVFFMDPQNGYITGQNMEIAGGLRLSCVS